MKRAAIALCFAFLLGVGCSDRSDSLATGKNRMSYYHLPQRNLPVDLPWKPGEPDFRGLSIMSVDFGGTELAFLGFSRGGFLSHTNSVDYASMGDAGDLFYDIHLLKTSTSQTVYILCLTPQTVQVTPSDVRILAQAHPELFIAAEPDVVYVQEELYSNIVPRLADSPSDRFVPAHWVEGDLAKRLAREAAAVLEVDSKEGQPPPERDK